MRKKQILCIIFIILYLVYSMQTRIFGSRSTAYSQIILLFIIGVSLYYTIYALLRYKMPTYMKGLTIFVLLITVYGLLDIIANTTYAGTTMKAYMYLRDIYKSLLPIFPFFVFTREHVVTLKWVQVLAIVLLFTSIEAMTFRQKEMEDEGTINLAYGVLAVVPLLAFWNKKKILQFACLIIAMFFILKGMKRGAILAGTICVVWFLLNQLKTATKKERFWVLLLVAITVFASIYMVDYMLTTSDYFNARLEKTKEGDMSHRDEIYTTLWNHFWEEENVFRLIFGNGTMSTIHFTGLLAHNDWLELLTDHGLLGGFIYILYWICFYITWRRSKWNKEVYMAVGMTLIICFSKTIFSMSYGTVGLPCALCIGYCMGMQSEHEVEMIPAPIKI